MSWEKRPRDATVDNSKLYVDGSEYFTVEFHHGGKFVGTPNIQYVDGVVDHYDMCHSDYFSVCEIVSMVMEEGYKGKCFFYYKVPGKNIYEGLRSLRNDSDVRDMMDFVGNNKIIEVYMEFGHTTVGDNGTGFIIVSRENSGHPFVLSQDLVDVNYSQIEGMIVDSQNVTMLNNQLDHNDNEKRQTASQIEGMIADSQNVIELNNQLDHNNNEKRQTVTQREGLIVEQGHETESEDNTDSEVEYEAFKDSDYDFSEDDTDDNKGKGKLIDESIYGLEVNEVVDRGRESSDELRSLPSEEEHEEGGGRVRYPQFRPEKDMKNPEFALGMTFSSREVLKDAIKEYAILNRKEIEFVKNDKCRVRAICIGSVQCQWCILGSIMQGTTTWQVKTYFKEHDCPSVYYHRRATSKWLSKTYMDRIRSNPGLPMPALRDAAREEFTLGISKTQAYKAKRKALDQINGSHREQYKRIWEYCCEVCRTNPNTTMVVKKVSDSGENENRFERLYVCLGACKAGFKHCRAFVGLDGCFLKGPFPCQLLSAVGIDADNCMFPVAYAVVEAENKSSWTWFIQLFCRDVGINCDNQSMWAFISDQQKGLVPALHDVLPDAEHRFCNLHMYKNFKKLFKGEKMKEFMQNASKVSCVKYFARIMEQIKEADPKAHEWLMNVHPRHWSRSHFSTFPKCDKLLNNYCEQFNSFILETRDKPIITMFEGIRALLMKRMYKKRDDMKKQHGRLTPHIQEILERNKNRCSSCICSWNGGSEYQLNLPHGVQYVVNLEKSTCTCRRWDLSGIPCAHAISAIYSDEANGNNRGMMPEDWVDECYTRETQIKIYSNLIHPINGPLLWESVDKPELLPPLYHAQPGRPKKVRRREAEEPKSHTKLGRKRVKMTCAKCGKYGHNMRTCKGQGKAPEVEASVLLEAVEERPKLPVRITDSVKAQLSRRKTMIAEKTAKNKAAKQVPRVGAVDDTVGRFRGADTVCARRTILAQKRESLRRGCTNEDAMDEATTTEFTPTRTEPPIEAAPPDVAPPDVALPEDDSFREVPSTRNPATPRKTARTRKAATPMKSADTSKTQEKPATPRKTATTRKAMAARKPVETTPSQEKPVTPRKAVAAKKPATRKGANTSKTEGKTEMLSARTRRAQEKPTTPANKRKAQEKSAVSTSKYQGKPASTSKSQGKSASKDQGAITKKPVKSMQEELLQLKKEVDNTKDLLMLELKRIQDLRKRGAGL